MQHLLLFLQKTTATNGKMFIISTMLAKNKAENKKPKEKCFKLKQYFYENVYTTTIQPWNNKLAGTFYNYIIKFSK